MDGHLVWDWNGTLLDDLTVVVAATNACLATVGGPVVTADEHRRDFRRPLIDYYRFVLGRSITEDEFVRLDNAFHNAYRGGLSACRLAADAVDAINRWTGTQSLLSMFFHDELLVEVDRHGLAGLLSRVDGLRAAVGGHRKAAYLAEHLDALDLRASRVVLIGDSVDDADAAIAVGASCVLYSGGFTDIGRLIDTGVPVADTLVDAVAIAHELMTAGR